MCACMCTHAVVHIRMVIGAHTCRQTYNTIWAYMYNIMNERCNCTMVQMCDTCAHTHMNTQMHKIPMHT